AVPHDLSVLELEAPLAGPRRERSGADPAAAVADHHAVKGDRGDRGRRTDEVRPLRVPTLAVDTQRLRADDQAQQVEMVDGHVDQKRLLLEVMTAAPRRPCHRVAAEV